MAKNANKKPEESNASLHAKIAELSESVTAAGKRANKAEQLAERNRVAAENSKARADEAVKAAELAKKDALANLGPSVLVQLNKASVTGDKIELPKGEIIAVLHINDHIDTDYLVSAIHTGKARVVPGITDGVFQMDDLIELRDAKVDLEAQVKELTEIIEGDEKGKKGGGS